MFDARTLLFHLEDIAKCASETLLTVMRDPITQIAKECSRTYFRLFNKQNLLALRALASARDENTLVFLCGFRHRVDPQVPLTFPQI
jgi:hypothetical protein